MVDHEQVMLKRGWNSSTSYRSAMRAQMKAWDKAAGMKAWLPSPQPAGFHGNQFDGIDVPGLTLAISGQPVVDRLPFRGTHESDQPADDADRNTAADED